MKRKIVMANDDIRFREKQLELLRGKDAEEIYQEIKVKVDKMK